MSLQIVILAAGQGSRMKSALPKVLHALAGTPLLEHVINVARTLNPQKIHVIYGHAGEQVRERLAHLNVNWIEQKQQLGTGHAVMQALPYCDHNDDILVLYGDVPLISTATLQTLLAARSQDEVGIVTAEFLDPTGLGRIIRDNHGHINQIIEHKDASEQQRAITEINSGILTASVKLLAEFLPQLSNKNSQGEYYLTDVIAMTVQSKRSVVGVLAKNSHEVEGVNDRLQLANLERNYQRQQAEKFLFLGVSIKDPSRFDLRGHAEISADVTIDVNVILEGCVMIGRNSYIGPNNYLKNVRIGEGVVIKANCVIEDAIIDANSSVGPFAHLRPGTHLNNNAKVGNFVEIKKSVVGENSKVNHLTYIGDATIGREVNVGAGTITCNYDGVNKHQTIIEDNAFIGSNTALVAPVTVEAGATIGAGSTVSRTAPAHKLTVSRARQQTLENWRRPEKIKNK